MVTPVDAVRGGMGFDEAGRWHQAKPRLVCASRRYGDADPLAAARGAICGLVAGAALWIVLIFAAGVLLRLI
ncbi:MAG TPA: hypothetical protein VME18_05225 [Acidobacteriaceae bacterium]|nr:hypothetical protein [Acidobacteriaceae bacterium]